MSLSIIDLHSVDTANPETWKGKTVLTFDIDWASDDVIRFSMDLLKEANIPVTWMMTHDTPLLEEIRKVDNFSLGIHPNFDKLLSGDHAYGSNTEEVIQYYLNIVPEAKASRSHSMTQNNRLLNYMGAIGMQYELNTFVPWHSQHSAKPWLSWDGKLNRVITTWEDDLHITFGHDWSWDGVINPEGLNVLNFHPIHVFLNTIELSDYETYKLDKSICVKNQNDTHKGIRSMLVKLLKL